MDKRSFRFWNTIVSIVILVISAYTYLSTIEPSASFWDCGEFIASSYKLEVGHPPGNPVFQLIARFFTIFSDAGHAAVAVNAMSAICSAFTIFLLYLTIVFFTKRLLKPSCDGLYETGKAIAIYGSAAVGALAYCFSDTFWFSAVEGEVYAMSSLFTALVYWCMTRWYEQADEPHANRWIVLISFLMGLSIGVHLLNLLTIPCLVFMYYYRKREDSGYTFWQYAGIFVLSIILLGIVYFVLVPYLPKLAAYFDIFFVNRLHLPVNSGSAFFVIALFAACFLGLFKLYRKGKAFWTTVLLCFTSIVVGFSIFSIIIIRSSVLPPTNENQPDNAFSLCRYLSREQYGSTPLLYGQYYGSPYVGLKHPTYWVYLDGRYKKAEGPIEPVYASSSKMFFPRMWSSSSDTHISFYETYNKNGTPIPGAKYRKPGFGANMKFFFDFQLNWMYWRYFMWNFAGRQNDIHSPSPGDLFYGNWECGIGFIDRARLGDQRHAPEVLSENKGKNHYFLLPLILGLLGLFFQFDRDKRGCWLNFMLFIMTGVAIVVYLNQSPFQVRERDYAYAGSFYAYAIWIGFAVAAVYDWFETALKGKAKNVIALAASMLCLGVPVLMARQNWDDHDRSNRRTAVEMARNYLNTVGRNGIIVTHGDNDTFPLWYAQEVEGVRPDVRIVNTSLLGTDWYIGQMKSAINDSAPIDLSVSQNQYLYGNNDFVYIYDTRERVIPISDVMAVFRHPDAKIEMESGSKEDYIMSRKISIPVIKENVIAMGIVPPEYTDEIPDEIVIEIPKGRTMISKCELFFLDLLSNYKWDRPLYLLSQGGEINIGLKDYLIYEGMASVLVPIRNRIESGSLGKVNVDRICDLMNNVYSWDALKRTDYYVDYQNVYTFMGVMPQRDLFLNAATLLMSRGDSEEAVAMIDKCQECVPEENFPLESIIIGFYRNDLTVLGMVEIYLKGNEEDKALDLANRFYMSLMKSIVFYLPYYMDQYLDTEFEYCCNYVYYLSDLLRRYGYRVAADAMDERLDNLLHVNDQDWEEEEFESGAEDSAEAAWPEESFPGGEQ